MDRGNIGNAYTAGMGKAWGITSSQYSMVVTVYYIAYICFHWVGQSFLSRSGGVEKTEILANIMVSYNS